MCPFFTLFYLRSNEFLRPVCFIYKWKNVEPMKKVIASDTEMSSHQVVSSHFISYEVK